MKLKFVFMGNHVEITWEMFCCFMYISMWIEDYEERLIDWYDFFGIAMSLNLPVFTVVKWESA